MTARAALAFLILAAALGQTVAKASLEASATLEARQPNTRTGGFE